MPTCTELFTFCLWNVQKYLAFFSELKLNLSFTLLFLKRNQVGWKSISGHIAATREIYPGIGHLTLGLSFITYIIFATSCEFIMSLPIFLGVFSASLSCWNREIAWEFQLLFKCQIFLVVKKSLKLCSQLKSSESTRRIKISLNVFENSLMFFKLISWLLGPDS